VALWRHENEVLPLAFTILFLWLFGILAAKIDPIDPATFGFSWFHSLQWLQWKRAIMSNGSDFDLSFWSFILKVSSAPLLRIHWGINAFVQHGAFQALWSDRWSLLQHADTSIPIMPILQIQIDRPCPCVETKFESAAGALWASFVIFAGQHSVSIWTPVDSGGLRWTVDRIHKEPQRTYPQLTGTLTVSHHLSPIFPTLRCVIAVCAGYGLAVAPFSYLSLCKTRTESGDTFNAHGWNRLVPLAASFCQLPFYYVGFESAWCDPGAVAVSLALRLSFLFAKHTSAQILSLARGQVSIVSQVVEGRQTGLCCVNLLKLWQG
jgi:hypothetical protein